MGWYNNISKTLGLKKKNFTDLSEEEKSNALARLHKQLRKTEQKIDNGEKEISDLGRKVLKSDSKFKSIIHMDSIRQKKGLLSVYVKNYITTGRSANALETCIALEQMVGPAMFNDYSDKIEALSPENMNSFINIMQDALDEQEMEGAALDSMLSKFADNVENEVDLDMFEELEKFQDDLMDKEGLSEDDKLKLLVDRL